MATISNATTGNDILVPTNNDVTYRGLSGDDVYICLLYTSDAADDP